MTHWKIYQPIEDVVAFDAATGAARPSFLQVTTRTDGASDYAVRIGMAGDERWALTVEQSTRLRALLEQAERDVRSGAIDADPPEASEAMEVDRG